MAKILVVDDDPDIREVCTIILEAEGHEVASAMNRAEGLSALKSFAPDLMILDVMMEEADDGLVMAQELRRDQVKVSYPDVNEHRQGDGLCSMGRMRRWRRSMILLRSRSLPRSCSRGSGPCWPDRRVEPCWISKRTHCARIFRSGLTGTGGGGAP